jgi:hypothetical protein
MTARKRLDQGVLISWAGERSELLGGLKPSASAGNAKITYPNHCPRRPCYRTRSVV